MRRLLRDLVLILVLAALWGASGYVLGLVGETIGIRYPLAPITASANVIIGLILLLLVTRSPDLRQLFYEGLSNGGSILIGCLWAMPMSLLLAGLVMWIVAIISRSVFPK